MLILRLILILTERMYHCGPGGFEALPIEFVSSHSADSGHYCTYLHYVVTM